jgi:putative endopeptidase
MVYSFTKRKHKVKGKKTRKRVVHKFTPQIDFYQYVNHDWISKKSFANSNYFEETQQKTIHDILETVVPELCQKNDKFKDLWDSFMNLNPSLLKTNFHQQISIMNNLIHQGSWPAFWAWFIRSGWGFPIQMNVDDDIKSKHIMMLSFSESMVTFPQKNGYSHSHSRLFSAFLKKLFAEFFSPLCVSSFDLNSIIHLEKTIFQNEHIMEDENSFQKRYHKIVLNSKHKDIVGVKELLPWLMQEPESVDTSKEIVYLLSNPKYFSRVMPFLHREWNQPTMRTFWIYQIIKGFIGFFPSLKKAQKTFFRHFLVSSMHPQKPPTRKETTLKHVIPFMSTTISTSYLHHFKHSAEIRYVEALVPLIKANFKSRMISKNKWLHPETRKKALEKLNKMKFWIGSKPQMEKDPILSYSSTDPLDNILLFNNFIIKKSLDKCGKHDLPNNTWKSDDEIHVFEVNAFYRITNNEIVIPNAVLVHPFIDIKKGWAYNMARIGTILCHELVHAFDSEGYQFDETGVYHTWWTPQDIRQYREKQKDVELQYDKFAVKQHIPKKAHFQMSENIADIGGFLLAEDVLETLLQKHPNQDYTNSLHTFYKEYAEQWRSTLLKPKKGAIISNVHAFTMLRVNCVLSRSCRFQKLYNIEPHHPMFFPSNDPRHFIW